MKSVPRLLQKIQRFSIYNTVFVQIIKSVKIFLKTYWNSISSYYEHVVQNSPQYESSCQHDRTNSQRKPDFSLIRDDHLQGGKPAKLHQHQALRRQPHFQLVKFRSESVPPTSSTPEREVPILFQRTIMLELPWQYLISLISQINKYLCVYQKSSL
ncbi:Hypothetical_protein [Hexamita inflata]|uniref:Hypothetical_protein n=1 Tax=Hexamita inflata TaxID=28002 RepID=A0AA86NPI7_9EUKA|nr:Hypothetical protein HINF_LOCUS11742 [Hexamita inflata]